MEKEKKMLAKFKEKDQGFQLWDQIDAATNEVEAAFVDIQHKVQMREQVNLEEYRTEEAINLEYEGFDVLKARIAERDTLFDELKKMHDVSKTMLPTKKKTRPAPHDPKDGEEPANHFTKSATTMLEIMLKDARFQQIQTELEEILDLLGIQASRHQEIKLEQEGKILSLNMEVKVCH